MRITTLVAAIALLTACSKSAAPPAHPPSSSSAAAKPDIEPIEPEPATARPPDPTTPVADPLPPGVEAALRGEAAGCVGVAADGTGALVLHDTATDSGGVKRSVFWIATGRDTTKSHDVGACPPGAGDCAATLAKATVAERPAILALTGGAALVPCATSVSSDGEATATPRGTEVYVSVSGERRLHAMTEDGDSVYVYIVPSEFDPDDAFVRLESAHWADTLGSVFILATLGMPGYVYDDGGGGGDDGGGDDEPFDYGLRLSVEGFGVTADELDLGPAPCIPRPPVAAPAPATLLDPETLDPEKHCIAMTADGRAALFVTSRVVTAEDTFEDEPSDPRGTRTTGLCLNRI